MYWLLDTWQIYNCPGQDYEIPAYQDLLHTENSQDCGNVDPTAWKPCFIIYSNFYQLHWKWQEYM